MSTMPSEPFDHHKIDELVQRRKRLGFTQRELEEQMGLSDRMIAKWEAYIRSPTAANLDRWARALGLKLVFKRVK
jgi:Predicted transcriptional regulator with C-terminal CBS domains